MLGRVGGVLGVLPLLHKCACEKGCCESRECGGVPWHHLSVLLLSCLVADCHRPSPGPPAPGKPCFHPCHGFTSIKLCSTQAIKSVQLRVNG